MEFIRKGMLLTTLIVCIESSSHVHVYLLSDLINMVGREDSKPCNPNSNNNNEGESHRENITMQPLLLSRYSFFRQTPSCESVDITQTEFHHFNWSCFTAGSAPSRDINWMFVDCIRYQIVSIQCLDAPQINQITNTVCNRDKAECTDFATSQGQKHVCSRTYEITKTLDEPSKDAIHVKPGSPSTLDIIAYFTGAFILTSFIIAVCIPTEKCKPSYECEQNSGLRIPLEIYELYGQHYRPSARRKLKTAIARATGSIPNVCQYQRHFQNVAVVSNSKNDLSWHRLSSASVTTASCDAKTANAGIAEVKQNSTEENRQYKGDVLYNKQILLSPSCFEKTNTSYFDEESRRTEMSLKEHLYFDKLHVQPFSVGVTKHFRGEFEGALSGGSSAYSYIDEASVISGSVPLQYNTKCSEVFPGVGEGQPDTTSVKCIGSDIQVTVNSGPRRFSLC